MSRSAVFLFLFAAACGDSPGNGADAASETVYGHKTLDAALYEAEASPKVAWNRMSAHDGVVLPAAHLRAIYIGQLGVDGSVSFDAYITWLITSADYWGTVLPQYGVGYGTFDGSTTIDTDAFFTPGMINAGIVEWNVLDVRIRQVLHEPPSDAGADDSGGDAAAMLPPIPPADGYIFFLPDAVNVDLGDGMTCSGVGGYHSYDGAEPYAIIPYCGRSRLVVSHETAEMCTDPLPGQGWFSDQDMLGEIGDLCNFPVNLTADGSSATALWSNRDGDCEPSQ
jgi:hypothetical protein